MTSILTVKKGGKTFNIDDTDRSVFVPISNVQTIGGTWTPTRIADNNIVLRKTAAADTTYLVATLRPRTVKIKSIDFIYSIGTLALTSQTPTISTVTYANNAAVAVAAHGGSISGSLATATQANPYVSTLTLGTPAFTTTTLVDVRIQVAIVAAATSTYDFYGLIVNFDEVNA